MTIPGENLSVFFSGLDAVSATWAPSGGSPVAVMVLYDAPYLALDPVSGAPVGSSNPAATVRDSEVTGVKAGDTLTVGGVTYKITHVQPDGTGITTLQLRK